MRVPAVRTGYEAVLPYRMEPKYCYMAEEDGTVTGISKYEIKIAYKSGTTKKLRLNSWIGKEESGVAYEHMIITDLKLNDKFKIGNTICYDKQFFEPDIFDQSRVIYKTGTSLKVALMESTDTHEDSCVISKNAANRLGTTIIKAKSFIIENTVEINNLLTIGTPVEPTTVLFTMDSNITFDKNTKLNKESLAILQNIKNKSPKAKMRGIVNNIKVFYNCEFDELSKTLQELVKVTDSKLSKQELKKVTGRVNSSYSIKGKPLIANKVEIKIYISDAIGMGLGDKVVVSNQLKATIGNIMDYDIVTETNHKVESLFSTTSVSARIVTSPYTIGTTTTLLNLLRDNVVDMYFK